MKKHYPTKNGRCLPVPTGNPLWLHHRRARPYAAHPDCVRKRFSTLPRRHNPSRSLPKNDVRHPTRLTRPYAPVPPYQASAQEHPNVRRQAKPSRSPSGLSSVLAPHLRCLHHFVRARTQPPYKMTQATILSFYEIPCIRPFIFFILHSRHLPPIPRRFRHDYVLQVF